MRFLRITAYYGPTNEPCCMRSNPDCDPMKAAECEASFQHGKSRSWDYVIPGTVDLNEYRLSAKLATGGMIGQGMSKTLLRIVVEDGLEASYTYNHEEWRDNPGSWIAGPTRDRFVRVVDGIEEVYRQGVWKIR